MSQQIISIKRGDDWKLIQLRAVAKAGQSLPDVTAATVVMIVRDYGTTGAGTIMTGDTTVAASGDDVLVTYDWAAGDTDVEADWDVEFEVTLSTGRVWTIPGTDRNGNPVYQRVKVLEDIGDAP